MSRSREGDTHLKFSLIGLAIIRKCAIKRLFTIRVHINTLYTHHNENCQRLGRKNKRFVVYLSSGKSEIQRAIIRIQFLHSNCMN